MTSSSRSPSRSGGTRPPRTVAALVRALEDRGRGPLLGALLDVQAKLAADSRSPAAWATETLALLADGLIERLATCGVRPLHRAGEKLRLSARTLAQRYEYHGTPLRPGERSKDVVVVAPGWTVGRRLAVRPVVREQTDDSQRTREQ